MNDKIILTFPDKGVGLVKKSPGHKMYDFFKTSTTKSSPTLANPHPGHSRSYRVRTEHVPIPYSRAERKGRRRHGPGDTSRAIPVSNRSPAARI